MIFRNVDGWRGALDQRRTILDQVQLVAESLRLSTIQDRGRDGSSAYTCETAEIFYKHHIRRYIRSFYEKVKGVVGIPLEQIDLNEHFPFATYFDTESTCHPMSNGTSRRIV